MNAHPDAPSATIRAALPTIVVAGLGYFVDLFDLLLFSVVRSSSLTALGSGSRLLEDGAFVQNVQLVGLMVGGIAWGMLGDRRGRRTVLFGSILVYSVATFANAFVTSVPQYAALRFVAGVGLAGELGAALTLVSELVHPAKRGTATAIVAMLGVLGAVAAALVGDHLDWRWAYAIGGLMGFALLALRLGVRESSLFANVSASGSSLASSRGRLRALFATRERAARYLKCILVGIPIWYAVPVLVTFAPEVAAAVGVRERVSAGQAVLWFYACTSLGDVASGLLGQWWHSRRAAVAVFLTILTVAVALLLIGVADSARGYLALVGLLGFGAGYWAVMITMAVEQFGTDLRATVGTSVPTFVRASGVLITSLFLTLRDLPDISRMSGGHAVAFSAAVTGVLCLVLAVWALATSHETFGRDLRFTEETV